MAVMEDTGFNENSLLQQELGSGKYMEDSEQRLYSGFMIVVLCKIQRKLNSMINNSRAYPKFNS